jgi:hypothetical protein
MSNLVYSLRIWLSETSTVPLRQLRGLGDIGIDAPGFVLGEI